MKRYNLIYPPTGEQVELLEGFEEERDRLLGRGWELEGQSEETDMPRSVIVGEHLDGSIELYPELKSKGKK